MTNFIAMIKCVIAASLLLVLFGAGWTIEFILVMNSFLSCR